ncbi:MAG: hypothetical protein ABL904_22615 [Hyphomicrobiaceae bacterium]
MSQSNKQTVPAAVYLVADNLDAVLAAGEDLLALTHEVVADGDPQRAAAADRAFADQIRTLEMAIAARALQARARAADVRAADSRYKSLIDLFIGGTAALQDAVDDLGDSTAADFHAGNDVVTYLRARNVIAGDAPGLRQFGGLAVVETFRVAERIELGLLMDLCATFLDRLEDHYELYSEDDVVVPATTVDSVPTAAAHEA